MKLMLQGNAYVSVFTPLMPSISFWLEVTLWITKIVLRLKLKFSLEKKKKSEPRWIIERLWRIYLGNETKIRYLVFGDY